MSQKAIILDLLLRKEIVPLPKIVYLRPRIADYGRIIRKLRSDGHMIDCTTKFLKIGGKMVNTSCYQYRGYNGTNQLVPKDKIKPLQTIVLSKIKKDNRNRLIESWSSFTPCEQKQIINAIKKGKVNELRKSLKF